MQMPQRKIVNAPVLQKLQIDLILAAACAGLSMERHHIHAPIDMRHILIDIFAAHTEHHTRNSRVFVMIRFPAITEQL